MLLKRIKVEGRRKKTVYLFLFAGRKKKGSAVPFCAVKEKGGAVFCCSEEGDREIRESEENKRNAVFPQ